MLEMEWEIFSDSQYVNCKQNTTKRINFGGMIKNKAITNSSVEADSEQDHNQSN